MTLYRNALARLEPTVELSMSDVSCLRKIKLITSNCNEYQRYAINNCFDCSA